MNRKILVSTSTFSKLDTSPLDKLKQEGFEVTLNPYKRKLSRIESQELLPEVIGLIAGLETLDKEVMSQTQLKVISRCGAGLSNVDLQAAKELGITVCSTPDAPTEAVAELTLGALLNVIRMISPMNQNLHNGMWTKQIGSQLKGKTVLIIGFGRIGKRVAELLQPFQVQILIVDPFLQEVPRSFKLMSLENALPLADVVTLHCSGDNCILADKEFEVMKRGSVLLNVARGNLIDEKALIRTLKKEHLAGVWCDTFAEEPYTGELCNFPHVLLTPHIGSYTSECRREMEMEAVDNLIAVLKNNTNG